LTTGVRCSMATPMENDATRILREVIDYCNDRWVEADGAEPVPGAFPTADMLTGKKMAYNECAPHVRLIAELPQVARIRPMSLGRVAHLKPKGGGESSMPRDVGRRLSRKGSGLTDPRPMAKAILLEPQFPSVDVGTLGTRLITECGRHA